MTAPRWLAGIGAAVVSVAAAGAVALVPQGTAVASPALPTHLVTG
ncbi:MAG: hypothetical protein QOK14_144, partial [Frankiaceae bacterium]|nr:hypothetical protein [Frankiaceae bacterium]